MTGKVLWLDDDAPAMLPMVRRFEDLGWDVTVAHNIADATNILNSDPTFFNCAIVDLIVGGAPVTLGADAPLGLTFARDTRRRHPHVRLIGLSLLNSGEAVEWFQQLGDGYVCKHALIDDWRELVRLVELSSASGPAMPRMFIVHGHNAVRLLELKNFLQNTLKLGEPRVLRELPSRGRTLIEKFEDEASNIDIAFVLMTADDILPSASGPTSRARQNVLFELGYFVAALKRRSGRTLLLHESGVELPSDINGIVYIDITCGIESVGEEIRREISSLISGRKR